MSFKSDLISAAMLLTRLPVRGTPTGDAAQAAWAWPLMGALVGLLAGLVASLGLGLGLHSGLVAGLTLAVTILVTGALHEDGLADSADGLWGGFDRERRLEIMRDSRIGTYGVLALGLSLLVRWSLIAAVLDQDAFIWALVALGTASRVPMIGLMRWLPPARSDGLARATGVPPARCLGIGLTLAALALLPLGFGTALLAAGAAGLVALGLGLLAKAKIGGQTGDILGASQQLAEIALLAAFTAGAQPLG